MTHGCEDLKDTNHITTLEKKENNLAKLNLIWPILRMYPPMATSCFNSFFIIILVFGLYYDCVHKRVVICLSLSHRMSCISGSAVQT